MRKTWIAVFAVSIALLGAACGDDDDDTSTGDNSSDSDGGGSSDAITLGYSAWPGWFVWAVADEAGIFDEVGVDVELTYFSDYIGSLDAMAAGQLDANSQTLNDTLVGVSAGSDQRIVLVNDNSTGNDQIIARPGIASVADLKGKKVAAEQGTVDHYLLLLALAEAKLGPKDIEVVNLVTDQAAAAFAGGSVDAVGCFAPFTTTALGRQGSRAVATSAEFPGAIPDHIVFKQPFAKDHAKEVQAVVTTWFDTLKWMKDNKDAATEIMAKRAGVSTDDYKSYDAGTTIFTRQQNLDAFTPGTTPAHLNFQADKIVDFQVSTGLAKDKPSLDGLFDDKFVKAVPE